MADTQQNHQYDLVIAGGAMAGATLALALEKLTAGNIRVAVVEAAVPDDSHPGYDARSIALAYGSCSFWMSWVYGNHCTQAPPPSKPSRCQTAAILDTRPFPLTVKGFPF